MRSLGRWINSFAYAGMFCTTLLLPIWILLVISGLFLVLLPLLAVVVTALAVLWFKPRVDALYDMDAILKQECPSARDRLWYRGGLSWHFLGVVFSQAVMASMLGLFLLLLSLDSREFVVALMGLLLFAFAAWLFWLTRRENRSPTLGALSAYVKSGGTDQGLLQQAANAVAQPIRDAESARLTSASS